MDNQQPLKFTDFEPKSLIGKYVLYHSDSSYGSKYTAVSKISSVTKTGFKIAKEGCGDYIFRFESGYRKGLNGRMNWSTISYCELITETQANEFLEQLAGAKAIKDLKKKIIDALSLANNNINKGQLLLIEKIIFNQNTNKG